MILTVRNGKEKAIYGVLYIILFACTSLYLFGEDLGILNMGGEHLIAVLVVSVMFSGFRFFETRGRVLWGLCTGIMVLAGIWMLGGRNFIEILQSYAGWLFASGEWKEEYILVYEVLNIAGMIVGIFVFELVCEKYFALKGIAAVSLLIWLIRCMFTKNNLPHIGVVLTFTVLLLVYVEWIQKREKKTRAGKNSVPVIWLTPFLCIYFLVLLAIPYKKEAYDWLFAKEICHMVKETITMVAQRFENIKGGVEFDVAFSGFSDEGKLFGNFLNDEKQIMQINKDASLKGNIYLIGKVFDEFDGTEWTQSDISLEKEREMDTLETIYAVRRFSPYSEGDYIYETKLHLKYLYFNSEYLFAPLKTGRVMDEGKKVVMQREGGNLLFDNKKGYGTKYDVSYMQMNLDHPGFYTMMEEQLGYEYGAMTMEGETNRQLLRQLQNNSQIRPKAEKDVTERDFEEHAKWIAEKYGQTTKLSEPVTRYLDAITQNCETEIEKLKVIEKELSHMTYTTTPGKIPREKDFLEYFLLESKEGYCSYFATAFVLMARAEGIPARYVQGFCIPASGKAGEPVTVLSSMAHAWPEVYLKGIGWVPFEPTPKYGELRYTPWKMQNQVASSQMHYTSEAAGMLGIDEEMEESFIEQEETDRDSFAIFLYLILLLIPALVIFFALDTAYGKRKYNKMCAEEKLRADTSVNLNILDTMGFARLEGETLSELKLRVHGKIEKLPLCFIDSYEEVCYGRQEAHCERIELIREEKKILLVALKEQKGKKYLFCRLKVYFHKNRKYL